jgi:cobalt-zinc-cadmium efflux system outer membrane protein
MNVVSLLTATLMLATAFSAFGQESVASPSTPLSQLLAEAEGNNPQISAANYGARAARKWCRR